MFTLLGKAISRIWPFVIVGWIALLLVCWRTAPKWEEIARHDDSEFFPADSPSRRAEELFDRSFPGQRHASSVVMIVHRNEASGLQDQDKKFIADILKPRLEEISSDRDRHSMVAQIRTFQDEGSGPLLVSADRQASLVVVELSSGVLDPRIWPTVAAIEELVRRLQNEQRVPSGLAIAVTGSGTLGRDITRSQLKSAERTKSWTILLVTLLLLLIYRSPLLIAVPLATVFVAVELSLRILCFLGAAGYITLFEGAQIYVTVLGYGAGVDYCLFLTARFKEEMDRGAAPHEAVSKALANVGAALTASAATVICGTGMMAFAAFGKFHQAGLIIPFSVLTVLCAALTFTPALLCLTGRWSFWPNFQKSAHSGILGRLSRNPLRNIWERVGNVLLRRPGTIWLCSVAAMAPFALLAILFQNHLNYGILDQLPEGSPALAGSKELEKHFPPGILGTTTVLIQNDLIDFRTPEVAEAIAELTGRLQARKTDLGIADLRSLAAPLGITSIADEALGNIGLLPEQLRSIVRQRALPYYVSSATSGQVTRLEIVSQREPFSTTSIAGVTDVERAVKENLPDSIRNGTSVHLHGVTASLRDLQVVTTHDRWLIGILVPVGVFVILVVLLRTPATSLYLILSVLFSYLATFGATAAVFWALDPGEFTGLDWRVPIFLFTILVAVGEDYNIFLMTRIKEEQAKHGPIRGITEAVSRTGGVISSCGFIMAGTFASLMAGSLLELKQMGFALGFGVLIDTLVVRPILVPAFLILLHGRRELDAEDSAEIEKRACDNSVELTIS